MNSEAKPVQEARYVSHVCGFCGVKGGAYVNHYDMIRCSCGKMFWALQPQRGGPLIFFRWPGNWRSPAP